MSGRAQLAAAARRLKAEHGDLLRGQPALRRDDIDRRFDGLRARRERSGHVPDGEQLALDLRRT